MRYPLTGAVMIALIVMCLLFTPAIRGGGGHATNLTSSVRLEGQVDEMLLRDSFDRADSPHLGVPWQEAGEVTAEFTTAAGYHVGPARAEVSQGALSLSYANHSQKPQFPFSSVNGRPVVYAPLARGVSARPAVFSFTFEPHPDNRIAHEAGLMSLSGGFHEAVDLSGVTDYTPVDGFGVSFGRSSSAYNNSQMSIIKYVGGTRTILAERLLSFQFASGKKYSISLTVAPDFSATVLVSDGVNMEQLASPATAVSFPIDQFFIADVEGGISSDTREAGGFSLRFDDVAVREISPDPTPTPVPTPSPTLTPTPTPSPTPVPCDLSLDSDEDGIPNCWEVNGIDINADGLIDYRLAGANPSRKDIYVEVDYMKAGDHTHEPRDDSLALVQKAFANSPIDEGAGINLHIVVDEAIPHIALIGFNSVSPCGQATTFGSLKAGHFGAKAERDDPNSVNVLHAKRRVFRYAIFGHRHGDVPKAPCDSSGVARRAGGELIVSLADFDNLERFRNSDCRLSPDAFRCGQRNIEAGTFMHELGHALGLRHGGNDPNNCKPNYLSVMSYSLQFPNIDPTRPLDYSRQPLAPLDEKRLDEFDGIKGPKGRYAVYGVRDDFPNLPPFCEGGYCGEKAPADGPINWDDSLGLFYGRTVKADINRIPSINCDGEGETLTGFDDWTFIGGSLRKLTQELTLPASPGESLVAEEFEPELTADQVLEAAESADFDADGRANAGDNCPAVFNPDQADADSNGIGDLCQSTTAADLSISSVVSQNPALIGSNVTYVVTVTNHGLNIADSAVLSSALPAGTTFVSCAATGGGACGGSGRDQTVAFPTLANGASATVTIVAAVDASVADGALLTNTSSIGSTTSDPDTANNTAALRSVALATQKNPIDAAQFFVREHYHDFLNREPDAEGLAFWTNEIESCGVSAQCREVKRINVSAAFFLSIEFQETGYLVYRAFKAAYGNLPGKPVPLTREDLLQGVRVIGNEVVVNADGWEQKLEQNKRVYFEQLAASERFIALYPQSMPAEQYVEALNTNARGVLSVADVGALAAELRSGAKTRGQALRAVAEDADLSKAELNKAFVLMQYFGYLRRNPDEAPEPGLNFGGWNFWLSKLNEFNGNFIQAEMVKAFLDSIEYRERFSS